MSDPFSTDDEDAKKLAEFGAADMGYQTQVAPQTDYDAMHALAGVGPPPKADSTPNDIAMALALFADAFADKGRAIGPILGAWASRKDPALESYELRMKDAMNRAQVQHLLQQGKGDQQQLELRKRALDLQAAGQAIQLKQLDARQAGVTGLKDAMVHLGMDPSQLDGMTDAQAAALKSVIASKMRQEGSNAAWDERHAQRVQDQIDTENRRPGVAAATTAATTTARLNATNGTPEEAIASFESANPKLQVTEPGTFRSVGNNPRTANSRQTNLMTVTRALDASAALRDIEREYAAIPFEERLGDKATKLASEYEKLATEHQGILQKIAGQGSGSAEERQFIREGLPSIHDLRAQAKLAGIEAMLHLNSGAMLTPFGIGIRGDKKPAPAKPSSGLDLGVTGGRKVSDTPAFPKATASAPQGGGSVSVRMADGNIYDNVPSDNLDEFLQTFPGSQVVQ